ncbi:PQQ-dependent dehydrogenase, methanol/ethanol family [Aquisediminimonas sediminicola]|uniref:PQQ-dependent dehydrogenase, methanol/ethanol family n=1 Tax=Alteraquisediminimonas sediminicola TaxID=2676787 RepID=UPI001C8DA8C8|nr:PQQ-dependent dehydrogenase, methanol/ethanol family [Aquisediminimonas sediminicola]
MGLGHIWTCSVALGIFLAGCSGTREDTGARIIAADSEPQNWLSTGRNYQETRFSPLDQINDANVGQLGLAWSFDLDTNRGQESTPLVIDGNIYTTSAWSKVQAFDGITGKLRWQFDPEVPGDAAVKACCDVVNRGAAYWNGKLFVGTIDGRLIAIDAATGKQIWSTVTVDQTKSYTITGAPRVVKGKVLIGNGGAEMGVRGYVSAYDAESGKMAWRFYTVPGKPGQPDGAASDAIIQKLASKTWSTRSWDLTNGGGGGTVWDSMAYDPELDLLYIGVGNGSYWPQKYRSPEAPPGGNNDNLFLASIVALRPETGEYVWHYQMTPGDEWDYTSTQHMILADLKIEGKTRKTLMQAPKNGFFYVLDRTNGQLISAKPYSKVNWATGIDMKTGRPNIVPEAHYSQTGKPWVGIPGPLGAHSWPPMSYSPKTGLVYIPTHELPFLYSLQQQFKALPKGYNLGVNPSAGKMNVSPASLASIRSSLKGYITAWDPIAQKEIWRVPQNTPATGGMLSTAGNLLFEGDATGIFAAYDARNGRKLWTFDTQTGTVAAPITWAKNGKQYITLVVGWGTIEGLANGPINWSNKGPRLNKSRVLTFALGGTAKLPAMADAPIRQLNPPSQFANANTIEEGRQIYHRSCYGCHGYEGMSGGVVPDLRYSATLGQADAWNAVVIDGILSANGMVSFKENYTPAQLEKVRAYIIQQAIVTRDSGSK